MQEAKKKVCPSLDQEKNIYMINLKENLHPFMVTEFSFAPPQTSSCSKNNQPLFTLCPHVMVMFKITSHTRSRLYG